MLQKITGMNVQGYAPMDHLHHCLENEHRLSVLQPRDVSPIDVLVVFVIHRAQKMSLAGKLFDTGRSFLRTASKTAADPSRAPDAVKWLRRAFSIMELSESPETPGFAELRVCTQYRLHVYVGSLC